MKANFRFDDLDLNYKPHFPSNTSSKVLDVGCGSGRMIAYLLSLGYTNVLGIDRDAKSVSWAAANVSPNIQLVPDLDVFLESHSTQYDLIIVKDMIYYLPKDLAVVCLARLGRCLKPGGLLIVEAFNGAAWTGSFIGYKDYHIEWIPTEHSLRHMLSDAGLRVTHLFALRPPSRGIKRKIFNSIAKAWRCALRAIYFFERGLDEQNPTIYTTKMVATAVRGEK